MSGCATGIRTCKDTLAQMSRDGVRRAIGFIAAAQRSYSSCTQYRENVDVARAALREAGLPDVYVTYVGDWHTHPGFVEANAAHVTTALATLAADVREPMRASCSPRTAFPCRWRSARSIGGTCEESAAAIAARLGRSNCALVYQSRSGRPEDPWLGPDIGDYLKEEHRKGLRAAVLCPVGFLCDHVEVLYDLDVEAANVCREIGLPMARASAVNDHPRFIDTMADAVIQTVRRYDHARPLQIVAAPDRE